MKITQKEFVNAMMQNASAFLGNTREVVSIDEVANVVEKYFALDADSKPAKRTCVARSKHLEFGENRSRLDLTGCNFGKYELNGADAYYCADTWVVCWYLIEK